ncbi:TOBE domain-containing protein [Ensifer sesbaniae]|uniref:TOBE domain-containing protein n=1 Tax=Ensifer sesbaniae TaxID=1214071 RepID=UPI001568A2BC|nr:TOBE domain-containing protein [Ensifer sesbaniae]NRQ18143.1 hypothetical protein [Ensifer sesbaniae]
MTFKASAGALSPKACDAIYVVLRPEAIQCSAGEPGVVNRVKGRIRQRVFKGNHTSLKVEFGEGHLLNALVCPSEVERLGRDDIWVGWSSEATTLIRPATLHGNDVSTAHVGDYQMKWKTTCV